MSHDKADRQTLEEGCRHWNWNIVLITVNNNWLHVAEIQTENIKSFKNIVISMSFFIEELTKGKNSKVRLQKKGRKKFNGWKDKQMTL